MICVKHKDGRIILMAAENNLKPMLFYPQSKNWEPALISGEELNDFSDIRDTNLVNLLLTDAKIFAEKNPQFKIK
jgi:hypothetical protein